MRPPRYDTTAVRVPIRPFDYHCRMAGYTHRRIDYIPEGSQIASRVAKLSLDAPGTDTRRIARSGRGRGAPRQRWGDGMSDRRGGRRTGPVGVALSGRSNEAGGRVIRSARLANWDVRYLGRADDGTRSSCRRIRTSCTSIRPAERGARTCVQERDGTRDAPPLKRGPAGMLLRGSAKAWCVETGIPGRSG